MDMSILKGISNFERIRSHESNTSIHRLTNFIVVGKRHPWSQLRRRSFLLFVFVFSAQNFVASRIDCPARRPRVARRIELVGMDYEDRVRLEERSMGIGISSSEDDSDGESVAFSTGGDDEDDDDYEPERRQQQPAEEETAGELLVHVGAAADPSDPQPSARTKQRKPVNTEHPSKTLFRLLAARYGVDALDLYLDYLEIGLNQTINFRLLGVALKGNNDLLSVFYRLEFEHLPPKYLTCTSPLTWRASNAAW
jgi:hypothetical protein